VCSSLQLIYDICAMHTHVYKQKLNVLLYVFSFFKSISLVYLKYYAQCVTIIMALKIISIVSVLHYVKTDKYKINKNITRKQIIQCVPRYNWFMIYELDLVNKHYLLDVLWYITETSCQIQTNDSGLWIRGGWTY
jgi:hypothetical protein